MVSRFLPWVLTLLAVQALFASSAAAQGRRVRYGVDPITDTIVTGVAFFSGLGSEMTIRSGELQAAEPGDIENIPFYDRWAAENHPEGSGAVLSNIGAGLAISYALADTIHTMARDSTEEGLIEGLMYLESGLVNWALVNIIKLTVRRPRPSAYAEAEDDPDPTDTNRELSFYSGHAAVTAGMAGTAAYLVFAREGGSAHAWTVLALGTALTTFVGLNRIRGGDHFPSDVFVGAMVGASVGVLVPHLHRMLGDEGGNSANLAVTSNGLDGAYSSFTWTF